MSLRTRAYHRHQNNRLIQKRKKLAEKIHHTYHICGILRKYNMACSCGMCDQNRPQKGKRIPSVKEVAQIKATQEEINNNGEI